MKHVIDEHAVFAETEQRELVVHVVLDDEVLAGDEAVLADVEVHLRFGRVAADLDHVLADEQHVVFADQPPDEVVRM